MHQFGSIELIQFTEYRAFAALCLLSQDDEGQHPGGSNSSRTTSGTKTFVSLCLHEVLIRQQSGNLLNCQMIC